MAIFGCLECLTGTPSSFYVIVVAAGAIGLYIRLMYEHYRRTHEGDRRLAREEVGRKS